MTCAHDRRLAEMHAPSSVREDEDAEEGDEESSTRGDDSDVREPEVEEAPTQGPIFADARFVLEASGRVILKSATTMDEAMRLMKSTPRALVLRRLEDGKILQRRGKDERRSSDEASA